MFEEAINQLESMGIPYTESEDGSLTIDISGADKSDLVTIISFLNDNGLDYTIDAESIVVTSLGEPVEPEMDLGEGGEGGMPGGNTLEGLLG